MPSGYSALSDHETERLEAWRGDIQSQAPRSLHLPPETNTGSLFSGHTDYSRPSGHYEEVDLSDMKRFSMDYSAPNQSADAAGSSIRPESSKLPASRAYNNSEDAPPRPPRPPKQGRPSRADFRIDEIPTGQPNTAMLFFDQLVGNEPPPPPPSCVEIVGACLESAGEHIAPVVTECLDGCGDVMGVFCEGCGKVAGAVLGLICGG